MRSSRMDLNLFTVFDAVYGQRNLTRAAEILCVTQPAVSNALARMRSIFDDPLFVSTASGMVPTPVAQNIAGRVGEALRLLASSAQEAEIFVPAESERIFRLSMTDLAEAILLPSLGEILQRHAPRVRIESYFTPREDVPAALATGKINLAIDVPLIDDPQLNRLPFASGDYACMLRHDHPFKGNALTLDDYLALDHIHVSSRPKGPGLVDTELNRLGYRRHIRMRVQHYMVAPLIALQADVALTAPEWLLQGYDARILALPFPIPSLSWQCYWHRSDDQDQGSRWLRDQLVKLLGTSSDCPR
ncbi:LysR family transcriptional regulator [Paraburkholderia pallida]|uniref:LysR family transcriptional regulator n=1 Tax=Paraburkholderia pallida TaxID=2547399 RepID=A0A4P7D953_9BURK|nr:LysR family transcriptional regulator [Paraburkholderia pallida]QBR03977.1 LysR family transcriptional regulator [Paraburkholderia pallida]